MNCKKVQKYLVIDYPQVNGDIKEHLLSCEECSSYLKDIEKIFERLKSYKPVEPDDGLWLYLPERIKTEIEAKKLSKSYISPVVKKAAFTFIILLFILVIGFIFFNPMKNSKNGIKGGERDFSLTLYDRDIYYELFTLTPEELDFVYKNLNYLKEKEEVER
jgi:hypothetical protein